MSSNGFHRLGRGLVLVSALLVLDGCPGKTDEVGAEEAGPPKPDNLAVTPPSAPTCERTIVADVAVLSQPLNYNRLGARQQTSQIFALARDVEVSGAGQDDPWIWLIDTPEWKAYETCRATPGADCMPQLNTVAQTYHLDVTKNAVRLRQDHRPRPMVLRANVGDCLEVNLANLLPTQIELTSATGLPSNTVGFHPVGMELVDSISNDGQFNGRNPNSQAAPGQALQHEFYASVESVHFVSSTTDENDTMISAGLFGAVHVQPRTAEYYRSQVTEDDLSLASSPPPNPGQPPLINYAATYDASTERPPWKRNVPILDMLVDLGNGRHQLIYSDLTAIITGENAGAFSSSLISPVFVANPALPERREPYREFTIIYHEPGGMAQAFPQFDPQSKLATTLKAGADQFAINYGTGGIGAEILANRLGVGPMADCVDCAYEEFFLSAWAVGDPAMVVDMPASQNVDITTGQRNPTVVPATLAYYPDDPSNVYHSYLGDHVKMRLHHGGATHHVHHLHAHQWLHSPNSDEGQYLDSQLFGPAASFTLEIAYNGSGNRNKTVGDSIFHCHFYPHFAQGMWGMWRVHDVFEAGTELEPSPPDGPGAGAPWPKVGARALPDGEIARGTPIPAIVPVPTVAMPPLPSPIYIADGQVNYGAPGDPPNRWGTGVTANPGYPFFIPGQAGHRAPHPPMDFAKSGSESLDGGLPRHVVVGGEGAAHYENLYDFSKFTASLDAIELPESGTPIEQLAMAAHAVRFNPSITPEGQAGQFVYNGTPAQQGAPYADPCNTVTDECLNANGGNYDACPPVPVANASDPLRYKGADIQHDVVLNKDGWHNPQQRMSVLWSDVQSTYDNVRPPQPLFFRANSDQCIEYWMSNLVPEYYELDNFQVRTPTDILGQHIHLVKFDVTASDGAGNGWNYEDGTFSYQAVQTRITDIMATGGIQVMGSDGTIAPDRQPLAAVVPQFLCDAGVKDCAAFTGAQATVQRWWADPLLNELGQDRTIRTVFTHDHFGPSTHQQSGLYAGLLVEPSGSSWIDAELGSDGKERPLGGRDDGGPTSWQAVIKTSDPSQSYREFALEFQDIALAYVPGGDPTSPYPSGNASKTPDQVTAQNNALNKLKPTQGAAIRKLAGGNIATSATPGAGSPVAGPSTPLVVSSLPAGPSTAAQGTYAVNYRSEPLGIRLGNTDLTAAAACGGTSGLSEQACDLAFAFASMPRANPALDSQHIGDEGFPTALTSGVYGTDPFTPIVRAYEGERVQVRALVGAHVQMHNLSLHGFKWLFEPSNDNSGYRDSQSMGISEHFELVFQMPPASTSAPPASAGTPTDTCGQAPQSTQSFADYLYTTSSSIDGLTQGNWGLIRSYQQGTAQCLATVPSTPTPPADWACPSAAPKRSFNVAAWGVSLTYNGTVKPAITNANGLVYTACDSTSDSACTPPNPTAEGAPPPTPLVLRAAAGECISVALTNNFDASNATFTTATPITAFGSQAIANSATFDKVALAPSVNVGLHPQMLSYDPQTSSGINVGFNPTQTAAPTATVQYTWYAGIIQGDGTGVPVEFGVVNLFSADPLRHGNIGLVGALVVEPANSTWSAAEATSVLATVTTSDGDSFSDAVLITIDTRLNNTGSPTHVLANYGTEPIDSRLGLDPGPTHNSACQYSNWTGDLPQSPQAPQDPVTPIYQVEPGAKVRFRVVHPWGSDQQVFELYGHLWQEEPFTDDSTVMGSNPESEWQGFRAGWGSTDRLNILIDSAGGPFQVPGDYLYRLRSVRLAASEGVWGLLRVGDPAQPSGAAPSACVTPFPQ